MSWRLRRWFWRHWPHEHTWDELRAVAWSDDRFLLCDKCGLEGA